MPALTDARHELFAQAYALTGHARNAALETGYTPLTGIALASKPDIMARVQQLQEQRFSKASITADRVLRELARIAFSDLRDLYDQATGELLPVHMLHDDVAAIVSQIKVEIVGRGAGKDREMVVVKTVKSADKMAALNVLARHFKIIGDVDDGVNAFANALADRLNQAKRRDNAEAQDARVVDPAAAGEGVHLTYGVEGDPSNPADVTNLRLAVPQREADALHFDLPTAVPVPALPIGRPPLPSSSPPPAALFAPPPCKTPGYVPTGRPRGRPRKDGSPPVPSPKKSPAPQPSAPPVPQEIPNEDQLW